VNVDTSFDTSGSEAPAVEVAGEAGVGEQDAKVVDEKEGQEKAEEREDGEV
jgi:hypothetical protein